jgi:hypothetical protein
MNTATIDPPFLNLRLVMAAATQLRNWAKLEAGPDHSPTASIPMPAAISPIRSRRASGGGSLGAEAFDRLNESYGRAILAAEDSGRTLAN